MLVLTRKQNQEIVIGDNIKVTVLKVKGNTVRLGIDAPRHVRVVRGELPPVEPEAGDAAAVAEVTLVFSDSESEITTERTMGKGSHGAESQSRIPGLKEGRATHQKRFSTDKAGGTNRTTSGQETIRFKDHLPASLQHNRLKQIVSEITRSTSQPGQ
ncbi:MAG: carbon storage regulator [Planctomycetota bacterium]